MADPATVRKAAEWVAASDDLWEYLKQVHEQAHRLMKAVPK